MLEGHDGFWEGGSDGGTLEIVGLARWIHGMAERRVSSPGGLLRRRCWGIPSVAPAIGPGKRPEEAEKPGFCPICRWPGTGGN